MHIILKASRLQTPALSVNITLKCNYYILTLYVKYCHFAEKYFVFSSKAYPAGSLISYMCFWFFVFFFPHVVSGNSDYIVYQSLYFYH